MSDLDNLRALMARRNAEHEAAVPLRLTLADALRARGEVLRPARPDREVTSAAEGQWASPPVQGVVGDRHPHG